MFGHNFRKTSILFRTFPFWSKFPNISILVKKKKNLDLSQQFWNISISANILKNNDFGQNLWKSRF